MNILPAQDVRFGLQVPFAIIGAGACGLTAALAARDAGVEPLVLEREAKAAGSTALSSGMIPACATPWQQAAGITDSVELMAADIQRKAEGQAPPQVVEAVCRASAPTLRWLAERHGVALELVAGFLYPGHSVLRMHAPPSKTGAALLASLLGAAQAAGATLLTQARATHLYADAQQRVRGLRIERPDGSTEQVGCQALLLACSGFGGNPALVRRWIPQLAEALYFGHAGNQGEAILWGEALGAELRHMAACQGHGSVAWPHGILITWALMMEGGIQVNATGQRFSNEHQGYSEQAQAVLAQPGQAAWNIYDERLHALGQEFEDYRQAEQHGAVLRAPSLDSLAQQLKLPAQNLEQSIQQTASQQVDAFGRDFSRTAALQPPFFAVRVSGALFHTQGGLAIDAQARVLAKNGRPLPGLFAGGGAACSVSGPHIRGYLSGNGLLTATALGYIAAQEAVRTL